MTYADVATIARRDWLEPLARVPRETYDAALEPLYRPLGGALMVRWLRCPALPIAKADPLALALAHDMLAAWIAASERDASPVPTRCERATPEATARAVLTDEFSRYWGWL